MIKELLLITENHETHTGCENVPHHSRYVRLVLCAFPLKKMNDDSETSGTNLWIIASLIFMIVQEPDNQHQSLYIEQ